MPYAETMPPTPQSYNPWWPIQTIWDAEWLNNKKFLEWWPVNILSTFKYPEIPCVSTCNIWSTLNTLHLKGNKPPINLTRVPHYAEIRPHFGGQFALYVVAWMTFLVGTGWRYGHLGYDLSNLWKAMGCRILVRYFRVWYIGGLWGTPG